MFINVSYHMFLYLNILFDEVGKGLGHEKKHFLRYQLYRSFKKISYGWLKLITCSYTCREVILCRKRKDEYVLKRRQATVSKECFLLRAKEKVYL